MTKAELEEENARLRGEVETLRYQMRLMLDCDRHRLDAARANFEADRCLSEIIGLHVTPTTLND